MGSLVFFHSRTLPNIKPFRAIVNVDPCEKYRCNLSVDSYFNQYTYI